MYKEDLVLNNLQWLIFHKTKANQSNLRGRNLIEGINTSIVDLVR